MDQEIKQKWIAALRSGLFIQGQGVLKELDVKTSKTKHCCLGVLCEILEVPETRLAGTNNFQFGILDDMRASYLPPSVTIKTGVGSGIQYSLARLNDAENDSDGRLDFNGIADYIEKNL